ncbi:polyphosphate kinase 1 [Parvibium lacunae]|uniref:Polyphosphate kinase n=1 Tax=Parvibium lacunae TaxID=1888893 RepID=A0A368L7J1_9BURK|nr:polyphosphate kinase 1 [Parvibium lacunae]RCS59584.1 polyphosphate kinase 1 [Parvibium lacunae]
MNALHVPDHPLLNRELGILEFNRRVLAQAHDRTLPLLERLRYLCIVSSNLDEFFEIRVSGILEQMRQAPHMRGTDGLLPREAYQEISQVAHELVTEQYQLFNQVLMPALEREGVFFHLVQTWEERHAQWAKDYFQREVLPVLTPIGLDPAHPFPRVLNKSLNFAVEMTGRDAFGRDSGIAIVQAPRALPRLIKVPPEISGYPHGFMMLTSIMQGFVGELFPGMEVQGCYQFRLTRNSDLYVDEEEITNLRDALKGELSQRHYGDSVRLEIHESTPEPMARLLQHEFGLQREDCYRVNGPVNLVRLMQVVDWVDRPDLKFPSFTPGLPSNWNVRDSADVFHLIAKQDILLHQPYQSFDPVLQFLKAAATDPDVVAIKQTIYRTGNQSELMEALLAAARGGKEVTVVVELMARFDEETNINWAARLEEVGAHVVYGIVGHKTHAKLLMVVRREKENSRDKNSKYHLRRYAHLGTGNYHPRTARLYTDFGLFTANDELTADVHEVFQQLTGLGQANRLHQLWQSPFTLHRKILQAIKQESQYAKAGKKALIMAKMNALLEPEVIQALYEASQAGVKIELIVRGVCALRPGVPGLSENISVRSIVGRFLEHHRIFYFHHDNEQLVYLSSADWMDRNFFRRVEVAFPILDKKLKQRVIEEGLRAHLKDTALAWIMNHDGSYSRRKARGNARYSGQESLLSQLSL